MNRSDWNALVADMRPRLAGLRVRVYGSGGAPFHHLALATLLGATAEPISADRIRAGGLDEVDVFVMPGGGVRAMSGLLVPLGVEGAAAVRDWVGRGGMYVGSCAGSFLPAVVGESFWDANPQARAMCMVNAQLHNSEDSEWAGLTSPGVGTIHVSTERPRHWLARGLPPAFRLVHYNGPMFSAQAGDPPPLDRVGGASLGEVTGVVRFAAATHDFTPGEAMMTETAGAATLFDSGVAAGAYTAVEGAFGRGTVVLFGSHPEFGLDTVQLGWDDGVRLFGNALARRAASRERRGSPIAGEAEAPPAGTDDALADVQRAAAKARAVADAFRALARRDPGAWTSAGSVGRFLGLEPRALWRQAALDAAEASAATAAYLEGLEPSRPVPAAVTAWLHAEAPADQDYGFAGLLPLLDRVHAMVEDADRAADGTPFGLEGPYDAMDRHPYQLGVSSYLSAAGLAASSLLSAVVVGRLLGDTAVLPSRRLLADLH